MSLTMAGLERAGVRRRCGSTLGADFHTTNFDGLCTDCWLATVEAAIREAARFNGECCGCGNASDCTHAVKILGHFGLLRDAGTGGGR